MALFVQGGFHLANLTHPKVKSAQQSGTETLKTGSTQLSRLDGTIRTEFFLVGRSGTETMHDGGAPFSSAPFQNFHTRHIYMAGPICKDFSAWHALLKTAAGTALRKADLRAMDQQRGKRVSGDRGKFPRGEKKEEAAQSPHRHLLPTATNGASPGLTTWDRLGSAELQLGVAGGSPVTQQGFISISAALPLSLSVKLRAIPRLPPLALLPALTPATLRYTAHLTRVFACCAPPSYPPGKGT
ncbi:hypothetical protein LX36DRAFT_655305 [Colletotrichum falcatum]|nr:hypothetical protein LX36DRAFT_655305 [Colletotrichum falcatum]